MPVELIKTGKLVKKTKQRRAKRAGSLTKNEHAIIETFAAEQNTEIQPKQIQALAKAMNRTTETISNAITKARESFVSRAETYANQHAEAVATALANGDAKSLEVAVKGTQWAMQNLSHEGKRIIDKEVVMQTAPRVMIGVKIGGLDLNKIQESDAVVVTDVTE